MMENIANVLIVIIALLHLYIVWLEMFAWTTRGPKVFKKLPPALFKDTKAMAGNQGLYNAFLAAGLIWTFFIEETEWRNNVALFFLSCIAIAGIYGAATVERKVLYIQTIPAGIAIVCILMQ